MEYFECVECIISSDIGTGDSRILLCSCCPLIWFPTDNEANSAEEEIWGKRVTIRVGFGVLVGWVGFFSPLEVLLADKKT